MQLFLRTAFALVVLMTFANGAYAADPATSPSGESKAIQGDEGKSNPPAKAGGGTSDAANPAAEGAAIQGNESNPPAKTGGGTSDAANPAAEDKAIQGDEGK
jgi:hypothetical protein